MPFAGIEMPVTWIGREYERIGQTTIIFADFF